ncbi:hypothetical protein D3C81_529490 [compost metagenome]
MVGCPFIEHQYRAFVQPGADQGQALALAGGQVGGGEGAVTYADFVRNLQALQVLPSIGRQAAAVFHQILEEEVVGENRGEMLTVVVQALRIDGLAVEQHLALVRRVEAQQQFDQGGFAAAVFTDDKQDLARCDTQVDGPQGERVAAGYRRKTVLHVAQLQAFEYRRRARLGAEQQVRLRRGEALGKISDTAKGDLCAADDRQCTNQTFQRTFHVQQHQHEAADHRRVVARPQ